MDGPAVQAPDVPEQVAATAGTASARVQWTAPAADGGAPVTGYTVTAAPGGRTCTTTGATQCVVAELTNGTAYAFTVTAENAVGTSAPSAPSAAVTPSFVPGSPVGVSLSVSATVTCTTGPPQLTVLVLNREAVRTDLRITTALGAVTVRGLKPGATHTQTFVSTSEDEVAAGAASIVASKSAKSVVVTTTYQAGHTGTPCA